MEVKICLLLFFVPFLGLHKMCSSDSGILKSDLLHRNRRQLLFLNQSFMQFIVGVATPTASKMVNVNWAIQAQFNLPWNRSQIPIDILEANSGYVGMSRGKRDLNEAPGTKEYENDARLYHFYKYIEDVLNGYSYNGSACLLQTLCKLGAEPLHTDEEEDLLHELASYILTPTNDMSTHVTPNDATVYIKAHEHGRNNEDCSQIYKECSISLVDMFSHTYYIEDEKVEEAK